jgi:hypothetical protein
VGYGVNLSGIALIAGFVSPCVLTFGWLLLIGAVVALVQ